MQEEQRLEGLVKWALLQARLNKKYDAEKKQLFAPLSKGTFFKNIAIPDFQQGMAIRDALLSVTQRKQLPLYNNIVHYIPLVQAPLETCLTFPEIAEKASFIKIYLIALEKLSVEKQHLLQRQIEALSSMVQETYQENFVILYSLYQQEITLNKKIYGEGKSFTSVGRKFLSIFASLYLKAGVSMSSGLESLQESVGKEDKLFFALYSVTLILMILSACSNSDLPEGFDFLRKFLEAAKIKDIKGRIGDVLQ